MWPFEEVIDGVNGLWSLLSSLPYEIVKILIDFAEIVMYLPVSLFTAIYNVVSYSLGTLSAFLNSLVGVVNAIIELFNAMFVGVLPSSWMLALITLIMVRLGLVVYYYLKDVSIAGFKI